MYYDSDEAYTFEAPQGFEGAGLFIFRELGSTGNYFRGAGEEAHTFGDLGSTAKKTEEKYSGIWGDQSIILEIKGAQTPTPCGGFTFHAHGS